MPLETSGEKWHVQVLGGFRVERGGQVIDRFRTHQTRALLVLLAYRHTHRVRRQTLLTPLSYCQTDR
jgi:DNA-binding SARP family transcriptional activator